MKQKQLSGMLWQIEKLHNNNGSDIEKVQFTLQQYTNGSETEFGLPAQEFLDMRSTVLSLRKQGICVAIRDDGFFVSAASCDSETEFAITTQNGTYGNANSVVNITFTLSTGVITITLKNGNSIAVSPSSWLLEQGYTENPGQGKVITLYFRDLDR